MKMKTLEGQILTPDGWINGRLTFDQQIRKIEAKADTATAHKIIPGFIDLHVHGGHGADTMEGAEAIRKLARWHARHGTTSLLATTVSAPLAELYEILLSIRELSLLPKPDGARILGGHLEGPFINPAKKGAQPAVQIQNPRFEDLAKLCEMGALRVITIASEAFEDKELIRHLSKAGIRVQIGHSSSSYEETIEILEYGVHGFTHLFNAMSGLHHRRPGVVGAALAKAEYAEIIPDLHHVHAGALLAALRSIPKLYCVTDASAACGMPDGEYPLGSITVSKCPNGVFLDDGTIASSTLTMDQAYRNLLSLGLSEADAVCRLSTYPADYLGLKDRGRIVLDAFADLVVLNQENTIESVFVEGEAIELSHD